MMNKKGWIRIAEAFLAIVLIAGVIVVVISNQVRNKYDVEETVYNLQKTVLDEIANNKDLREAVFANDEDKIKDFIGTKIPVVFDFTINICELNDVCPLPFGFDYRKNIYANEVVISSTLKDYAPKKVKLFMWEKAEE